MAVIERLDDPESATPLAAKLDALTKQRKNLERDEADLRARQAAWQQSQLDAEDIVATCRRISADMAGLTAWADQRAMAQALKVRVEVEPGGKWTARSDVVQDVVISHSCLFTTTESSIGNSTTSSCSARRQRSS